MYRLLKHPLYFAALLALISHAVLLLINFSLQAPLSLQNVFKKEPLNVQLQKQDVKEPELEVETQEQTIEPQVIEPQETELEPVQVISRVPNRLDNEPVVKVDNQKPNNTITINEFKRSIISEAADYVKTNSKLMDDVDETFEYKTSKQVELSLNQADAVLQASLTGVGKTITKDGRHSCYAIIYDFSTPFAGESKTWQDCTPKKKFILDMNAPDNG